MYRLKDIRGKIESDISSNRNRGFRSNNKLYERIFSRSEKEATAVDKFGDTYFSNNPLDDTVSVSVTLPKSLLINVDEFCKKNGITRSRFIRKCLEYSLDLRKT